jgi:hypothetical protein
MARYRRVWSPAIGLGWWLLGCLAPAQSVFANFSQPGCNDDVLALTEFNGDLIAGGRFTLAGGLPANRVARWDGAQWHALGGGLDGIQYYWSTQGDTIAVPPHVLALTVYEGDLIAGGSFALAEGDSVFNVTRWDGAQWLPVGAGFTKGLRIRDGDDDFFFPPLVASLVVWNGDLYAGGTFRASGETTIDFISRWNGQEWTRVGNGFAGGAPPCVQALIGDEARLIAGGEFTYADFYPATRLAGWDGLVWEPFEPAGINGRVEALTYHDGDVIAGGSFSLAGGIPALHVARWQGSTWEAMDAGIASSVHALAVFNTDLYAGSYRWTGTSWVNALQSGGAVYALLVYRNRLVAGGDFHAFSGRTCWNIAAWPEDFTAAYLKSFTAQRENGAALIAWETATAGDHLGFHLWREAIAGARQRLTSTLPNRQDRYEIVDPSPPAQETRYWLQELETDGDEVWFGPALLAAASPPPATVRLSQNIPNPFNPCTSLSYTLARSGRVHLAIHDLEGRVIKMLCDGLVAAGRHSATWDGTDDHGRPAASGVYVARLTTDTETVHRKLVLAR